MPGDMKNRMAPQPGRRNMSGLLWLFAGLCIGLFISFLAYLKTQPKADVSFSEAVSQEIKKAKQLKQEKQQRQAENPDKKVPKFDFYTILKDYEVFVPDSEVSNEKSDPEAEFSSPSASNKKQTTYYLQAGSFQRESDADKRRATLAFLGITSSIQAAQINSDTWYRVKIGPLEGKHKLNKVRDQLIENDIPTLIMVMK